MKRFFVFFCVLLLSVMVVGCGKKPVPVSSGPRQVQRPQAVKPQEPGPAPKGTFKPYSIAGIRYYPLSSADGYEETGIASWYGRDFHGLKTANGETYDMRAMTAAHKILPMNTSIRLTRLDNGKQVTLRVNDRGPFVGSRIVDVTQAAAEQLDMVGPGTAMVRLEVVGVAGRTVPSVAQSLESGTYFVQVGSFRFNDNAQRLVSQMRANGYSGSRLQQVEISGATYWRVQAGEFKGMARAKRAHADLREEYPSSFLIAD